MLLKDLDTSRICRELALLLHAGIGLADGVYLLHQEEQSPLKEHLERIAEDLGHGSTLSESVQRSNIFPEYVWRMIRTGEETGRLESALYVLGDYYEERHRVSRQIKSAVAYPAMVLLLMLAVLVVLLVKVMPVFDRVYASLGSSMTGVAASLLYLGQGLDAILPVLLILLFVLLAGALVFRFCPAFQAKVILAWKTRFGDRGIARKFNNANFARAMAMGLGSGMTMDACLELAQTLLQDAPGAAQRCASCAQKLQEGASIREAVEKTELLPPTQCQMLSLGIHSGNADTVMDSIANTMLENAQFALDNTISRIEPALVLICSLLVGSILLAVMLPLLDILSVLG